MISGAPIVVLDACVLYPAALRSLMMWLAVHEVIRPKWSEQIHDEWMRSLLRNRPDLTLDKLERTRRLMDVHAGDCLVTEYERHIPELNLPDPDDRHVLAAGIEAGADAIITWNVADFPPGVVAEYGIEVQTPDQFVDMVLEHNHAAVIAAIHDHRASLKNPPRSPADYLEILTQQGLKVSSTRLRESMNEI